MEQLSAIVADIYDAGLDPALWSDVLHKAANFIGGISAAIYGKDASARSGNVYYDDRGLDRRYVKLYFDKYVKLDPATTGQFFAEMGEPIATADLMRYEDFLNTRFYREWARPQGLVDFVSAVLERSTTSATMFGCFRHARDGVVDDAVRRKVCLIAPHLRRAVLIGKTIELMTAEASTLADTLDSISAGMFLVDAGGRIVHANIAGHAMLAVADVLRAVNGHLTTNDAQARQALLDIFAAAGAGDAAVGGQGIALPLMSRGGERHVVHVLPLTSGARRRAGAAYAAVAALFVHKAALETSSLPALIARTYRLTPMELRILLAIVEVGGVPEVAEALGIAETTVKTHLGHLYEKTDTHRQADLVKIVAGFANPLIN